MLTEVSFFFKKQKTLDIIPLQKLSDIVKSLAKGFIPKGKGISE